MVKMKALKSFGFAGANEGHIKRGREFNARDDRRAADLEAEGLAFRMSDPAPVAKPQEVDHPANKAAQAGPLDLAGGPIGADAPAPSSPPDRPPRRKKSEGSKDELL